MTHGSFRLLCGLLLLVSAGCGVPEPGSEVEQAKSENLAADAKHAETPSKPAPEKFRVKFELSTGEVIVEVTRSWSPRGADRFYNAVEAGFYDGCRFFRVVPNFIVQFGINGDPDEHRKWSGPISDDPVVAKNLEGTLTYAKAGPDTRTTQLFFNLKDNTELDLRGFAPFGKVIKGMDAIRVINPEYEQRPQQRFIEEHGNKYLKSEFPRLDYIKSAVILPAPQPAEARKPKAVDGKTTLKPNAAKTEAAKTNN